MVQLSLKDARELMAMTQDELATKSGVSRATIIRLEQSTNEPLHSTVLALEDALGIARGSLVFGEPAKRAS